MGLPAVSLCRDSCNSLEETLRRSYVDQFDTIDMSDNEIVKLENFPYLNRLGTLIINNNRITRINLNLGEFLPKLHSSVLTNNRLVNLVEIDPLASIPKLQHLSKLDNNITKKPNYRLYVIHKLKSLRVLDFIKVKAKIRLRRNLLPRLTPSASDSDLPPKFDLDCSEKSRKSVPRESKDQQASSFEEIGTEKYRSKQN